MPELVRALHNGRESTMPRYFAEKRGAQILSDEATHNADGTVRGIVVHTQAPAVTAGYEAMTNADLNGEIARRNADRDESDLVTPTGRTKADLVAALVTDDADHNPSVSGTEPDQNEE